MSLEPLIPYVQIPDLVLVPRGALGSFPPAPLAIKPFGTLVAVGVYLGSWLVLRHGRRVGLHEQALASFMVFVGGGGFLFGHVLDVVFYFPERILADPLSLVRVWDGLSSFGGFSGALLGALAWRWRYRVPMLPYADVVASGFPVGWCFGRLGCSVAHDHPGLHSDAWYAVQYPDGGRLDLGLAELMLCVPIAVAALLLRRRHRPWGFFLGFTCSAYAPLRFCLDFLRARDTPVVDARYLGLTPAQWGSALLLGVGLACLVRSLRASGDPEGLRPPAPPAEFATRPARVA